MKHSLFASLLTLATVSLQATAAVVDYVSGAPISSSGYYQYHTKWVTTTCYETITKSNDCSYDGGDFIGDYETVSPQVYPGPDYKDYNTVYETLYETAYPYPYPYETASSYPYKAAQSYPSDIVCYPETVYSTVYPESSDKMYHTFTASGTDATVTGSPVYHTMDSTILETITATPSGNSGLECSADGPWIVNPGFDDITQPNSVLTWPGAWFPSDGVSVEFSDTPDGLYAVTLLPRGDGAWLEQAIILPTGRTYSLHFWYHVYLLAPGDQLTVVISFGSYTSRSTALGSIGGWQEITIDMGRLSSTSDCVPVVFSIKVTRNNPADISFVQLDGFELLVVP